MNDIPMPERIARLPRDAAGRPVPWFVYWKDGVPDFRVIEPGKVADAYYKRLCFVCGQPLGKFAAFVIGPISAIYHTSAEPPNHRDCALFSVRACPFLSTPKMHRRERDLPQAYDMPGVGIKRNPGVALVWVTKSYRPLSTETGPVCKFGDPVETLWFCEGRPATRAEILHSVDTGIPILRQMAEEECPAAVKDLEVRYNKMLALLPP
jgi:hypothetical protein